MIYNVVGRETIDGVSESVGFTAANIPPTKPNVIYALIQPTTAGVRVCIDGTTPTSTKGIKLLVNLFYEVWGSESLTNFRCIDDDGTADLEVIYFGSGG